MNVDFGPVPPWSAPLSEKLVVAAVILLVVLFISGSISKSRGKIWEIVIFAIVLLTLTIWMALMR
jgi:hypothetical protein